MMICPTCGSEFELNYGQRWSLARGVTKHAYCSAACSQNGRAPRRRRQPVERRIEGGYVYVYRPEHPDARRDGYITEGRLIGEALVGRRLRRDEDTHHINRDTLDNRPENIRVVTKAEHNRLHEELGRRHMAPRESCYRGHLYEGANVFYRRDGSRECRECMREQNRQAKARRRGALVGAELDAGAPNA